MALFGKKKEEKKEDTTCCCAGEQTSSVIIHDCCGVKVDGICCIKVLGSGCKACHQLYDNTVKAVEGMGIEVVYVTDLQKIMEYGAMSMPALVVNEQIVSSGKVLKPAEILKLIGKWQNKGSHHGCLSYLFLFLYYTIITALLTMEDFLFMKKYVIDRACIAFTPSEEHSAVKPSLYHNKK